MAETITEHAPAKINLALHVTGRRDDSYHLIESLVTFATLGDEIRVSPAEGDLFVVDGPMAGDVPADERNLVIKARDLMRSLLPPGSAPPVCIDLRKNLPVASGIGGGSSDAAATLRALAKHWRVPLERWTGEAIRLGADLPMCLATRPLLARGVGERLTFIDGLPALAMVLVNPGVAVSTPAIFGALKKRENDPLAGLPESTFGRLCDWLAASRNDLQAPATSLAPVIADALAAITASGASFARMSGSGATCFGLYPSRYEAENASKAISARHPDWFVAATETVASKAFEHAA